MGEIESACVAPCVVLVINDNPYGLMFALRYSYRSCPQERLEFMCWTLEAYKMTKILFKGLYEEWSYVELSTLQVCLEEQNTVDIHAHLQDIIIDQEIRKDTKLIKAKWKGWIQVINTQSYMLYHVGSRDPMVW